MDVLLSEVKKAIPNKFQEFNYGLTVLGNTMVKDGICNSYDIVRRYGEISAIVLNVKPMCFRLLPSGTVSQAQEAFNKLTLSCGITREELEQSGSGIIWETADTFNMKCARFNEELPSLGDRFVKEGICNSYRITRFAGDIDSLQADIRPKRLSELPSEINQKAQQLFSNLVYSCGITPEEYEESYAGVEWLTED